ncbi:unnamed protein product [Caenorhabditis auriculariae]|uniref:Uncharacterized protein n=2 Tax=Caenorhabditis auriculariae TaxID=2777116 RepID=A0A8S1H2G5_9PELO|nr:unnamed protein product [Caenorhabditis auriculariae]
MPLSDITNVDSSDSDDPVPTNPIKNLILKETRPKSNLSDDDMLELFQKTFQMVGKKGHKSLVRQLWAGYDVVEHVGLFHKRDMQKALYDPAFISCPEGIKLVARFVPQIGVRQTLNLIRRAILNKATEAHCRNYGQLALTNYFMSEVADEAVRCPEPFCKRYYDMLVAFSNEKASKPELDMTFGAQVMFILDNNMSVPNNVVRLNAERLFFLVFPLIHQDEEERQYSLSKQFEYVKKMLLDDCYILRAEAVRQTLKLLADFWNLFPPNIVDDLVKDRCIPVRLAIYEGMQFLIVVPGCANALEVALKVICPRGINDSNAKVRKAAAALLAIIRKHRFIKLTDVVTKPEMMARLAIEQDDEVAKELVRALYITCDPEKETFDVVVYKYVQTLANVSRMAALNYFRLVYDLKLLNMETAVGYISRMTKFAYRIIRKNGKTGELLTDEDPKLISAKLFLDCAAVLSHSIRKDLSEVTDPKIKVATASLISMQSKLVNNLLEEYKNSSLVGTLTMLVSWFPRKHLQDLAMECLEILDEPDLTADHVSIYAEVVANFDIGLLFKKIKKDLAISPDDLTFNKLSPVPKRNKKADKDSTPVQKFTRSVNLLKFVLRDFTSNSYITSNSSDCLSHLEEFYEKLEIVKSVIASRILGKELLVPDKLLFVAFEIRQLLPALIFKCQAEAKQYCAKKEPFVENMCADLDWYNKMTGIARTQFGGDDDVCIDITDFFISLTKTLFHVSEVMLSAYNFNEILVPKPEKEDGNSSTASMDSTNEEDLISYPEKISIIILSFCQKFSPSDLLIPVIRMATVLSEFEYREHHHNVKKVMTYWPKWFTACFERGEVLDEKETPEALRAFWKAFSRTECFDSDAQHCVINYIVITLIKTLIDVAEEEMTDPRGQDYQIPKNISWLIHKFLIREKDVPQKIHKLIGTLVVGNDYLHDEGLSLDMLLVRLGAAAQMAILCDPKLFPVKKRETPSETVQDVLNIIDEETQKIAEKAADDDEEVNRRVQEVNEILRKPQKMPFAEEEEERGNS